MVKAFSKNGSGLIKGVFLSLCITLIGIFLFAFILKFVNLSENSIKIINQVIKILSILFGVRFCLKHDKRNGLIKGAVVGALYTILSYLIFSLFISNFCFNSSMIIDTIFATIIGVICGILFVNLKR